MKATFENSVNVLVNAYLNDDLMHQNCACCAVGNLISHACNLKVQHIGNEEFYWVDDRNKVYDPDEWLKVFGTKVEETGGLNFFRKKNMRVVDKWFRVDEINSLVSYWADETGYSIVQLASIERAFESVEYGENNDTWMFNGLMAVVDVLAEIHNIDLTAKESAKKLFVKP